MTLPLPYILPFFRKKHMKLKDFAFFRKKNMKLKDNWSVGDCPPNLPKAYRNLTKTNSYTFFKEIDW